MDFCRMSRNLARAEEAIPSSQKMCYRMQMRETVAKRQLVSGLGVAGEWGWGDMNLGTTSRA